MKNLHKSDVEIKVLSTQVVYCVKNGVWKKRVWIVIWEG